MKVIESNEIAVGKQIKIGNVIVIGTKPKETEGG
jgi:hypothetical protein